MHFRLSANAETFRDEIRDYLKAELPPGWPNQAEQMSPDDDNFWAVYRDTAKTLGAKGWLSLDWPKEYGGQERNHEEVTVFREETAYYGIPGIDAFGTKLLAPTLIMLGTDEQKRKHLGPIARGETFWCEGFSEPGAGSDLAAVQTKAVEQKDHFVINGQKIWTSGADRADWCFVLARTDPQAPKHQGLSFFLVDMKTPGVEARPLKNIVGFEHSVNEVFFDEVRVPKENLVGGVNKGWHVVNTLLSFERSGIELVAWARRQVDDLLDLATETEIGRNALNFNPSLRHELARLTIDVEVAKLMSYRLAWMQDHGVIPDADAAQAKVFVTELLKRIAKTGMQLLGHYGQLIKGSAYTQLDGVVPNEYMTTLAWTVAGGSSEVLRTMIAVRGLGLPK